VTSRLAEVCADIRPQQPLNAGIDGRRAPFNHARVSGVLNGYRDRNHSKEHAMPLGPLRLLSPDHAWLLARHGYLFTARLKEDERRALYETGALDVRLLGRPTLFVTGAEGVDLFYDESRLQRHKAVPPPVALSLFGPGAVHGLDDEAHRHRKRLFRHALTEPELDRLLSIAERRWSDELDGWAMAGGGEMYSSAIDVFGASIIEWAGIDEPEDSKRQHARWLAQIVDGFGVPGPAYLRAAVARRRCDQWAAGLIRNERDNATAESTSWLAQAASFLDYDGRPLPGRTAAVELLNVLRPTVAVSWLASFGAIALAEHPDWRARIRDEDAAPGHGETAQAFAHEVRRYYPFAPVLAARARHEFDFAGHTVAKNQRVLLDVYGTNHGPGWDNPWAFDPGRFVKTDPCTIPEFVPQGGGPVDTGHRCPGEGVSNGLLALTIQLLAAQDGLGLTQQDRDFSMRRMPTRPASGTRLILKNP
jgi:fatty-acid peroxygenase